jgi:hypothetical protein
MDIFGAIEQSKIDVLANILETTDQINSRDSRYLTPLMVAILSAYSDLSKPTTVFDMVLSRVEHVDARPYNDSALNLAMRKLVTAKSDVNNVRLHIVRALLEKGANPHYPNGEGYSPFMIAVHERGEILFAFLSYWKDEYMISLIPTIDDSLLTDFVTNMKMCENCTISIDNAIAMRVGCCQFIDMKIGNSKDIMLKWLAENFSFPYKIPTRAIEVFINRLNMLLNGSGVKFITEENYAFSAEKYNGYQIRVVVECPSTRVVGCVFAPHVRFMQFVEVTRKLE